MILSAPLFQAVIPAKAGSFVGVSIGMPIAGGALRACKREAQFDLLSSRHEIGPRPSPG
jgi:hypothetical protein